MVKDQIFIEPNIQNEFDTNGVVKLKFASITSIKELINLFHFFHPPSDERMSGGYYFSIFGAGKDYMLEIKKKFFPVLKPILDQHFKDYKVLSIILQIKGTGENSMVGMHQDLTCVDENLYQAATVWIPLNESTSENGSISFLNGSQRFARGYRAHTADYYQFKDVEEYICQNAKKYDTNLGEALIFDPGTIHFSSENKTNSPRLSIAISVVSMNAQTELGFVDKLKAPDVLEIYDVPDDFYYRYSNFSIERFERPSFGIFREIREKKLTKSYNLKDFKKMHMNNCKKHRISKFKKNWFLFYYLFKLKMNSKSIKNLS